MTTYTPEQLVALQTARNNRRWAAAHAHVCAQCGDARPSAESAANCVGRGETPPTSAYHLRKSTATVTRKTWRAGVMSAAYAAQDVADLLGDEDEEE